MNNEHVRGADRWIEDRIRDFMRAGLPVNIEKDRWGGRYVIATTLETDSGREVSRGIWSILPKNKCLITRPYDRTLSGSMLDRETRYPTNYLYRLFHDDRVRLWYGFLFMFPFIALSLIALIASMKTLSVQGLAVAFSVPVITWVILWILLKREEELQDIVRPRTVLMRFTLGLVVGGLWLLASAAPFNLGYIIGGLWIFTVVNVVWLFTVGYDHWLPSRDIRGVGGRLPPHEAISLISMSLSRKSERTPTRNGVLQAVRCPEDLLVL